MMNAAPVPPVTPAAPHAEPTLYCPACYEVVDDLVGDLCDGCLALDWEWGA